MQAHREAGIDASLVLEIPDVLAFGADATVQRWSTLDEHAEIVRKLCRGADAVMAHGHPFYLEQALALGKPVLYRSLGSHSRRQPERVREGIRHKLVRRATTGTGDLSLMLGVPMVGAPFPVLPEATPTENLAVHSPSNPKLKGTWGIRRAAKSAGWKLKVKTGTHAEVLNAKSKAALVIDQFGDPPHPDGMGVSGVEALAMGVPVIGRASLPVQEVYAEKGCPAILVNSQAELVTMLSFLRVDEDGRERLGKAGRRWVADFHSGEQRAYEDKEALGWL